MSLEEKIIGGENVLSGQKKYVVSHRHKNVHKCSGFLISENEILTAANCLDDFFKAKIVPNFEDYSVVLEQNNGLSGIEKNHSIKEVRAHRKYNSKVSRASHNIGLIMVGHQGNLNIFQNI